MKLQSAKMILDEIEEWVNYHFKNGAKPAKKFDYSLFEVAKAREIVSLNNVMRGGQGKVNKTTMIPDEMLCAAIVLASKGAKLQIGENSAVKLFQMDNISVFVMKENLNQVTLHKAIEEATASPENNGQVIKMGV